MALTKNDIKKNIANAGFSQKQSSQVVEALLEVIKQRLENGEDVLVSGFGRFQVKDRPPRNGRNLATGEVMVLEARRVVTFKYSGKLKQRINQGRKNNRLNKKEGVK